MGLRILKDRVVFNKFSKAMILKNKSLKHILVVVIELLGDKIYKESSNVSDNKIVKNG